MLKFSFLSDPSLLGSKAHRGINVLLYVVPFGPVSEERIRRLIFLTQQLGGTWADHRLMWDSCGLVRCSHIVHLKLSVQAEQAEIATHLPPKKGSLDITRFTHLAAACVVRYLLGNELLLHLYVVVWKPWGSGKRWEEPLDRLASCGLDLEVNR